MDESLQANASVPKAQATTAELMTPNPLSIQDTATVWDAVCFLTDKGFSAAPVINDAGRPVGVLSRTDLIVHNRAVAQHLRLWQKPTPGAEPDLTPVRQVMTPFVILVAPETPADEAARQMVTSRVHRLFVVDREGALIGVLTAMDLLRCFAWDGAKPVGPSLLDDE